MELDRTETELGIGGDQLRDLETCGVADSEVLEVCWKEFFSPASGIKFHHLCLMLQAYCLIYPVKMATSTSKKNNNPTIYYSMQITERNLFARMGVELYPFLL